MPRIYNLQFQAIIAHSLHLAYNMYGKLRHKEEMSDNSVKREARIAGKKRKRKKKLTAFRILRYK